MDCQQFRREGHDLAKGHVPEERREHLSARLRTHLAECPACQDLVRTFTALSCRELVQFLNAYLDGELEPERRALVQRHLVACPECRAYLASYRRTMDLSVRALREVRIPPPPETLVQAILEARRRPS